MSMDIVPKSKYVINKGHSIDLALQLSNCSVFSPSNIFFIGGLATSTRNVRADYIRVMSANLTSMRRAIGSGDY